MSKPDNVMIEADMLTKQYGPVTAVQAISFTCQKGEVVGFLGPNGAGKTTTMRILTGYMPPTSGAAYIAGYHTIEQSIEARQRLGYLPETVPLYPEMSVEGYLAFVGKLRRVDNLWDRVDDVLESVDLLDRAESYISSLSKGMRQRVGLAQALLHDPDVLILDEPTIGLDPAQIVEIRELITSLGQKHTVLLSTHILAEVEQICNRVIMIINGRIWADMPMQQIKAANNLVLLELAHPTPATTRVLAEITGVTHVQPTAAGQFHLSVDGRDETRMALAETAVAQGWGLLGLSQTRLSLEDIFLSKLKEAQAAEIGEYETTAESEHSTASEVSMEEA
jgi:ABC-2 type transport system ATP-binding protein